MQLELKSLVAQLRKRAAANGVDAEALLPVPSSPQRKALESVLRETEGGGGAAADPLPAERSRTGYLGARPGTADSERLSLRDGDLFADTVGCGDRLGEKIDGVGELVAPEVFVSSVAQVP